MFDVIKDLNAEIVILDTFLSQKGDQFYMNLATNVEVVKSGNKSDFRTYILNSVNPKMRSYYGNASLDNETRLKAAYYLLFNALLEYLHRKDYGFSDKDLSFLSNNLNLSDSEQKIKERFIEEEKIAHAKDLSSALEFSMSAFASYKAAIGEGLISPKHIESIKMLMGKEFMENVDGGESGETTSSSTKNISGCYIATCVYGSYDCPEVWSLRRYRDYYLKERLFGRMFIRVYYFISPKLVKLFGKTKWFNRIFKKYLDKKINKLRDAGYESTPYLD